QSHPHVKQLDIANHFNSQDPNLNLDQTTISKILKDKSKWLAALKLWIEQVTRGEMIITELMIKEKATIFAKALNLGDNALKFLNEWIHKFKRHNVFNADETVLFFCMAPDQTLASQSRPGFKKASLL
ncbi:3362_t:CDS:2, partial [Gigaspora rosea]